MAKHVSGCGLGVGGLGDHLDVRFRLQHHPDPVADQLVIVGEDDADRLRGMDRLRIRTHTGTLGGRVPSSVAAEGVCPIGCCGVATAPYARIRSALGHRYAARVHLRCHH